MQDIIAPLGMMEDEIKAIGLLCRMLALLQHSEEIEPIYEQLRSIFEEYMALFKDLYKSFIKVKFHHLGHLPEDLLKLTKNMSCFPGERKHRDWKSVCVHVFRNVEHTTTCSFLNFAIQDSLS